MFKCQECNKTSQPGTRKIQVVTEKRLRDYYSIIITSKNVKEERFMQFERKDIAVLDNLKRQGWKVVHEVFSKGWETAKIKIVCEDCAKKLEAENEVAKK